MKVIIPAAGKGVRLAPHTDYKPKPILPIAGKTIVDFIMDKVQTLENLESVIFIVGYLKENMIDYIQNRYKDIKIEFVVQEEYKGLAHAISLTEAIINKDDELFIILGDTIFEADISSVVQKKQNSLATLRVEDPRRFGVVYLDGQRVAKVVEKPKNIETNIALTGLYYIKDSNALFNSINYIIKHDIKINNEYQITDAIEHMIESGVYFTIFNLDGWYDCGEKKAMIDTNSNIIAHQVLCDNITNSSIIEPCFIAKDVIITNSTIGPYVSIGASSTISNSTIKTSIIGDDIILDNVSLEDEIITFNN